MSAVSSALLATKFRAPLLRHGVVGRPRLVLALDEGLRMGRALTLVSAPAGFGKTTLIAEWIRASQASCAWVSLDESENDPVRYVTCLAHALDEMVPGLDARIGGLLGAHQMPAIDSLVTAIINELAHQSTIAVLILDDYQQITSRVVHDATQVLLDHRPEQLHVVIASREDPPLSLSRMRVRSEITEIRAAHLRFSVSEVGQLLMATAGLALPAPQIRLLESRTEGWPAALQLAALSMTDRLDSGDFLATFGGSNVYVIDFLAEEVLRRFDPEVRTFLVRTSVLGRFCADLCAEVARNAESRTVLGLLERANLLVALDSARDWYRYHNVFAEFLRTQIPAGELQDLHRLAAGWFERHGDRAEAVRHTLQAGDEAGAVRLIAEAAPEILRAGAAGTLLGWLEALPESLVASDVRLRTFRAWALTLAGRTDEAATAIALDDFAGDGADLIQPIYGVRAALRAWLAMSRGDYRGSIALANQALELLPGNDDVFRGGAYVALAGSQRALGQATAALASYREMLAHTGHYASLPSEGAVAYTAILLREQCRADEAISLCRQALSRLTDRDGSSSPLAGFAESALGTILFDQNRLDEADEHLSAGEALCARLGMENLLLGGRLVRARLLAARGETDAALALASSVRDRYERFGADRDALMAESTMADARLFSGDLRAAQPWLAATASLPFPEINPSREFAYVSRVRARLALGDPGGANAIIGPLKESARANGRLRSLVTLLLLEAMCAAEETRNTDSAEALRQALELAAESSFIRLFLNEGPALGSLLSRHSDRSTPFASEILAAAGIERSPEGTGRTDEQLSEREIEILRLMEAGQSNKEIADRLFLSLATVKWHANNAYGKLGVHSRTQALARARALRVL